MQPLAPTGNPKVERAHPHVDDSQGTGQGSHARDHARLSLTTDLHRVQIQPCLGPIPVASCALSTMEGGPDVVLLGVEEASRQQRMVLEAANKRVQGCKASCRCREGPQGHRATARRQPHRILWVGLPAFTLRRPRLWRTWEFWEVLIESHQRSLTAVNLFFSLPEVSPPQRTASRGIHRLVRAAAAPMRRTLARGP